MQMHDSAGRFQGAGGLPLYYQNWYLACSPKATIMMIHGLGSHCGWFDKLARKLIEQEYVTIDYILSYSTTIARAIALAPALEQVDVPRWKLLAGKMLSWVYPQFTLNTGIDLDTGIRDRALLEASFTYVTRRARSGNGTQRKQTIFCPSSFN